MASGTGDSSGAAPDAAAAIRRGTRLGLRGDHNGSCAAFREALESGHPEHAPEAGIHLGALLHQAGDLSGATTAYKRAFTSDHPDYAPKAALELAAMMVQLEFPAEAKLVLEYAAGAKHPDHSPNAARQLGILLEGTGDTAGAREAYGQAVDSGHPYQAPPAAMLLGALLRSAGDDDGARQAFQLVVDSCHPDHAAAAAAQLQELAPAGHVSSASAAPNSVAEPASAPDPAPSIITKVSRLNGDESPTEMLALAHRRWRMDDVGGARQAFQQVIDSGDVEHFAAAATSLGHLLLGQGDDKGARVAYLRAIKSGPSDAGQEAAYFLGQHLHELGYQEGALQYWRMASDPHRPFYAAASYNCGALLTQRGDLHGAEAALRQAVESNDPEFAEKAAESLRSIREFRYVEAEDLPEPDWPRLDPAAVWQELEQGVAAGGREAIINTYRYAQFLMDSRDVAGAQQAFRLVIDSGDTEYAPEAGAGLGIACWSAGDLAGARDAFQHTVDQGRAELAGPAALSLGLVLTELKDLSGARAAYQTAIDSGNARAGPAAAERLALLLDKQGDAKGAEQAFRHAISFGEAKTSQRAAYGLGQMLAIQGDFAGARDALRQVVDPELPVYGTAKFNLGASLHALGDVEGAREAFGAISNSADPEIARKAAAALRRLPESTEIPTSKQPSGDESGLEDIPWNEFEEGINSGDDEAIAGILGVGLLLVDEENYTEAARAYRMAIDSGHPEYAPDAAEYLGKLLHAQDDLEGARAAYERAVAFGPTDAGHLAAFWLGQLLQGQGNLDGARKAYQRAIDFGQTGVGQEAAFWLGQVLDEQGDIEGACAAWGLVSDPEGEWYAGAALNMGISLKQSGDLSRAADALRRAAESDNPDVSPGAWNNLASVLWAMGDRPGTHAALQRAADSGHPKHAPAAADYLRYHFPELSTTPELADDAGPVLPVLQPLDWADTLGATDDDRARLINSMSRPLMLAGLHVGYVAFGRDATPESIRVESPRSLDPGGPISPAYEAAALMNLRLLGFEWRRLEIEPPDGEPFDVLACDGHPLAAAAVLDRSFLAQAQLILGCDRILVAIPNRDLLQVGRADLPDQQLAHFAASVEAFHDSNDDPISPLTFYATNGVVDGICDPPPVE